jgi:hypothetical protein
MWKAIEDEDDEGQKHLSGIRLMMSNCARHLTPITATAAMTATANKRETIMSVIHIIIKKIFLVIITRSTRAPLL